MARSSNNSEQRTGWQHPILRRGFVFLILFGLWLLLSGKLIIEFIVLGAVSSALVVFLTSHLVDPSSSEEDYKPLPVSFLWLGATFVRFLAYVLWLMYEIVTANIQVAYQILHPKLPISPRLVVFQTTLDSEPSQILLAQSITLTPGTITVDLDQGQFVVHALSSGQDQILAKGGMQERVGRVFAEQPKVPDSTSIINNIDELNL